MGLARNIKRRLRAAAPAAIFLCLFGYFAWNATRGDLGLHAYSRREGDLAAADRSLAAANAERDAWQQRVSALGSGDLDRDRARRTQPSHAQPGIAERPDHPGKEMIRF